jgi:hypothetical protein
MIDSVAPYTISLIVACVVSAIVLLFGLMVMWQMWSGRLDLAYLISEPQLTAGESGKPKASLSRFQFLIFTFVIAGLYLVLSIEAGTMVEVPGGALVLLGISGGSYLVSKVESTRAADVQVEAKEAKERSDQRKESRGRTPQR